MNSYPLLSQKKGSHCGGMQHVMIAIHLIKASDCWVSVYKAMCAAFAPRRLLIYSPSAPQLVKLQPILVSCQLRNAVRVCCNFNLKSCHWPLIHLQQTGNLNSASLTRSTVLLCLKHCFCYILLLFLITVILLTVGSQQKACIKQIGNP